MLEILYSNGLKEIVFAHREDTAEVRADLENGNEVFHFEGTVKGARNRLARIIESIRTHGSPMKPVARPDETLFVVASVKLEAKVSLSGPELGRLPDVRQALLDFDKEGLLSPLSIRKWIQSASRYQDSGDLTTAFHCAGAALDRSHLAYIRLLIKDDTLVKRKAATITFDSGNKSEGVEIMKRLAESRLQYIEKDWKSGGK